MTEIPNPGGMPMQGGADFGGINWGALMEASGGAFEPLPNGDYDIQITKAEATKSSTQKTMFKLTMNVVAGPHTNRKVWTNLTISPDNPNALGIFFAQMKALGLDANYFAQQPSPDQVAQALEGRYARVGVKQRTWQGSVRNEVTAINPAVVQGGAIPSMAAPAPMQQQPVVQQAPTPAPAPAPVTQAPPPVQQAPVVQEQQVVAQPPMQQAPPPPPVAPAPVQEAPPAQQQVAPAPVAQEVQQAPQPPAPQAAPAPAAAPAAAPQPEQQGSVAPPPIPF